MILQEGPQPNGQIILQIQALNEFLCNAQLLVEALLLFPA